MQSKATFGKDQKFGTDRRLVTMRERGDLILTGVRIGAPWRRKWQPVPVFLPGKSQGQRSLVGYSPWGCKDSDTT